MHDSAYVHKKNQIKLILPPCECPQWVSPNDLYGPLLYLSWGLRYYGKNPIPVARREGWTQMLVVKGNPQLLIVDQRHSLSPGKMLLIPPEIPYGLMDSGNFSQTKQLTWIWNCEPTVIERNRRIGTWYSTTFNSSSLNLANQLHLESRRQIQISDQWTSHAILGIRNQLDVEWTRSQTLSQPASDLDFKFETAVRWMKLRLDDTKPIGQLQEYLQMSPSTLKRIFLLKTQKSPQRYFQELKLETAKKLLLNKEASVKSVALSLGYRHVGDFTRAFKRRFHLPPSDHDLLDHH